VDACREYLEYLREKLRARQDDLQALQTGRKSPEQLRRENGHFAGLRCRVNLAGALRLY
jgi:hypothetical protein